MATINQYRFRFLVIGALLILPFLRMLLRDSYGLLHPEVLGSILTLTGLAAGLARVARKAAVFHIVVVALTVALSVNALHNDFLPKVQMRWIIVGFAAFVIASLLVLRPIFYQILLLFLLGNFAVDIVKAATEAWVSHSVAQATPDAKHRHVVHLILDEMIGLAAMPPDCAECVEAADRMRQVLERGNFRIYPYAFSNYRSTLDSIPSILNGRLLQQAGEFVGNEVRPYLRENRYFDAYLAKKYSIRVYESDYLQFDAPEFSSVHSTMYGSNNLRALHRINLTDWMRFKQLWAVYLMADGFWSDIWMRVFPLNMQPRILPVGALALEYIWPARILREFREATQDTLLFIHLLVPHSPYVYTANGTVRAPDDWYSYDHLQFYDEDRAEYFARYRLYCEQVQFLTLQIQRFLEGLKESGLYESTTVIIHGDHGSRLRLLKSSEREQRQKLQIKTPQTPASSRYDYVGEIELRDLLNRWATLLAVKLPGAKQPETVTDKVSVLAVLDQIFGSRADARERDDWNAVYLFNADGTPRRIPILDFWKN